MTFVGVIFINVVLTFVFIEQHLVMSADWIVSKFSLKPFNQQHNQMTPNPSTELRLVTSESQQESVSLLILRIHHGHHCI